jgi:hypothetical protein
VENGWYPAYNNRGIAVLTSAEFHNYHGDPMNCIARLPILVICATVAGAQTAQALHVQDGSATTYTRDGGVSEVLQSIYIPPLLNAPFSAIVHTEWMRPMTGGGNFTFVNQRRVARDSRGRIHEERC